MNEAATSGSPPTMEVALKDWRSDRATGERELKAYTVQAPEWSTSST